MAEAGHEIASHGYGHDLVTVLTRDQFREDVKRAKSVLEDAIGRPVLGYRAPTFTITPETLWALPVLLEEGYAYDSSIFPVYHDQYGIPGANPSPHLIWTHSGTLWEVPPSTCKIGWTRIPIAGGGYFRFFPYWLMVRLMRKVEREGESLVFYLHPWEFDASQPRMTGPFRSRFRHYFNLAKTEKRFCRLIEEFSFAPIRESIPMIGQLYGSSDHDPSGVSDQIALTV
jgi:polysaccharide deacetylase family protein (PEP-CTERM system associated)